MFRLPYTQKIDWDPSKDLRYVIGLAGYAFGLVVPADSPIKSMQDYIAYAKANPGKLNYGTPGLADHAAPDDGEHRHAGRRHAQPHSFKGNSESLQAVLERTRDVGGRHARLERLMWSRASCVCCPPGATSAQPNFRMCRHSGIGYQPDPNVAVWPGGTKGTDPKVVQTLHDAFKSHWTCPTTRSPQPRFDMDTYYMDSATYKQYALDTMKTEKAIIEKLGMGK